MRMTGAAVLVILMCACLLGGCGSEDDDLAVGEPQVVTTADMSGTGPGTLVQAMTMPRVDRKIRTTGAQSVRIMYRSTSGIDGSPTTVSGAVFIPPGQPPAGGWPIVAYAHGTSGVKEQCAPSLSNDIFGAAGVIAAYVKLGYAVAAADYQGLGAPGGHPYLDAKTAGLNIVDSVRALRKVAPGTISTTWAGFGGSQGGAAVWAANEQASTYGTDLNLVGTVSLSPAADVSGYAAAAAAGKLTKDQEAALVWMLMGMEQTRPGFPIDDYRHGSATQNWQVLAACTGPDTDKRAQVLADLPAQDLKPSTPEATKRLAAILASMALPQQKAAAPMLIIYGGKDTYINAEWTTAAIAKACAMGSVIDSTLQEGKGHGDVDASDYLSWLGHRFQGEPAPNTCHTP